MPAWSGLWNGHYNEDYSMQHDRPSGRRQTARLNASRGMKPEVEKVTELTGSAPGNTASYTYKRAEAPADSDDLGGARVIETVTMINRATTAADETDIDTDYMNGPFGLDPSAYPEDASGNAGGGKGGY